MAGKGAITRRGFLGRAGAAVTGPYIIAATALGAEGRPPASERVVTGAIGLGARGRYDMDAFLANPQVQMVAVCDVQAARRDAACAAVQAKYGNQDCRAYRDLRELLARGDIDAVLVATGDRWHSLASILAMQAGKDVYCEKPMSLTIGEGRAVADTSRRLARVYQCGTQRRNDKRFMFVADCARTGKLGQLHTIRAYTPAFLRWSDPRLLPPQPEPPREAVDWDLWLGAVPWRPFNAAYIGGLGGWSHVPDLGGGGITDWGTHQADLSAYTNDAEQTSPLDYEQISPTEVAATYANGVKLVFTAGLPPGACLMARFEGSEGWLSVDDNRNLEGSLTSLIKTFGLWLQGEQRPGDHIQNFLDAIRQRKQPVCHAEVAHRATTACHAANLCVALGRPLKWDPAHEEFVGDADANRLRSRALREPWRM